MLPAPVPRPHRSRRRTGALIAVGTVVAAAVLVAPTAVPAVGAREAAEVPVYLWEPVRPYQTAKPPPECFTVPITSGWNLPPGLAYDPDRARRLAETGDYTCSVPRGYRAYLAPADTELARDGRSLATDCLVEVTRIGSSRYFGYTCWLKIAPPPADPGPPAPPTAPGPPPECQRSQPWPAPPPGAETDDAFWVLVTLDTDGAGADAALVQQRRQQAAALAAEYGVTPDHVYGALVTGFAGKITKEAYGCLAKFDRRVRNVTYAATETPYVAQSPPVGQPTGPQVVPTGVRRVGGDRYPAPGPDGRRADVDADIAVLDTGVDLDNPDLNVVGGVDCVDWDGRDSYDDDAGHGTRVASAAAARDNDVGIVGTAPGARIWAVRTSGTSRYNTFGSQMCGLDWIAQHADVIDVVNDSSGGPWLAPNVDRTQTCRSSDPMYDATCLLVERFGVPYVTITGNFPRPIFDPDAPPDEALIQPAGFDQVIAVSGLADYDGLPGGLARPTCPKGFSEGRPDVDDTIDDFSGYGQRVDLIAPSVCQQLLGSRGQVVVDTGTSFAAPLVTGAVALHRQVRPGASPAQVVADLRTVGSADWNAADDPDGLREPLLDVTGLARLPAPGATVPPAGDGNGHLGTGSLDDWRAAAVPPKRVRLIDPRRGGS